MKNTLTISALSLMLAFVMLGPVSAHAETDATSTATTTTTTVATTTVATTTVATTTPVTTAPSSLESLMAKIQELTKILTDLKARMFQTQSEVKALTQTLKENLREGASDEDIKKIQDILASDPTIYPSGLRTGFFGPMTKEALKKFQAKHGLDVTGEIDAETKAALETLLEERFNGQVPPGLLKAPGIQKKFEDRLRLGCADAVKGASPFCAKVKVKYHFDDDADDEDEDEDSNEDEDEDEDDDSATSTLRDAARQIDEATIDIMKFKKMMNNDDDASAAELAAAKELLADAEAALVEAKTARRAADYNEAVALAEDASDLIDDAEDALKGEDSDDEDEDADSDEDEDEDDEDEDA